MASDSCSSEPPSSAKYSYTIIQRFHSAPVALSNRPRYDPRIANIIACSFDRRRYGHCNPAIPRARRQLRQRAHISSSIGNRPKQTIELSGRRILGDKLAVSVRRLSTDGTAAEARNLRYLIVGTRGRRRRAECRAIFSQIVPFPVGRRQSRVLLAFKFAVDLSRR